MSAASEGKEDASNSSNTADVTAAAAALLEAEEGDGGGGGSGSAPPPPPPPPPPARAAQGGGRPQRQRRREEASATRKDQERRKKAEAEALLAGARQVVPAWAWEGNPIIEATPGWVWQMEGAPEEVPRLMGEEMKKGRMAALVAAEEAFQSYTNPIIQQWAVMREIAWKNHHALNRAMVSIERLTRENRQLKAKLGGASKDEQQ